MAGRGEEEQEERGFKVIDRRGGGEAAAPEPEAPKAGPEAPKAGPEAPKAGPEPPEAGPEPASAPPRPAPPEAGDLPKIDFPTFVLSLFTSALYQMGLAPDPGGKTAEPNLLLARQTIDTLEMLEAKTRGNLDADEAALLENALFELRMRFVELSK